jgi:hypothetical protein
MRVATKRSRKEKKQEDVLENAVERYAETRYDLERLKQECDDAAENLQKLSKRTVLDSLGSVSPFRDAFMQKLGTLVDFDVPAKDGFSLLLENAGSYVLLLQRVPMNGWLSIIPLNTRHDDIDSAMRVANVEIEHDLRRDREDWDDCPAGQANCPCKDNYSYTSKLKRIIKLHRYAVIALLHETAALHNAFLRNPESMCAKLKKDKK